MIKGESTVYLLLLHSSVNDGFTARRQCLRSHGAPRFRCPQRLPAPSETMMSLKGKSAWLLGYRRTQSFYPHGRAVTVLTKIDETIAARRAL